MNKKYELLQDDTIVIGGNTLYRIRAVRDVVGFLRDVEGFEACVYVQAGDLGGYVASEKNLSHDLDCWIYDDAKVFDKAKVSMSAKIYNYVQVYGNAEVSGNARIWGKVEIYDKSKVYGGATVSGSAKIYGNSEIHGWCFPGHIKLGESF